MCLFQIASWLVCLLASVFLYHVWSCLDVRSWVWLTMFLCSPFTTSTFLIILLFFFHPCLFSWLSEYGRTATMSGITPINTLLCTHSCILHPQLITHVTTTPLLSNCYVIVTQSKFDTHLTSLHVARRSSHDCLCRGEKLTPFDLDEVFHGEKVVLLTQVRRKLLELNQNPAYL